MVGKHFDSKKVWKLILMLLGALGIIGIMIYVANTYIFTTTQTDTMYGFDSSYNGGAVGEKVEDSVVSSPDSITTTNSNDTKVIKTATLSMTVLDFDSAVSGIKNSLESAKGYVQSLSDSGTYNNRYVYVTVRVPLSKFDEVLNSIKGLAIEVTSTTERADDVTEAYQDLEARLDNQRALEEQYVSLLSKATKVSDILLIQKELGTVRELIEQLETQIKYYDSQADMATISVTMSKASEALNVTGEQWKPFGVVKEAFSVFVLLAKALGTLIIWIAVFSPIVLIPLAIYFIVKKVKKSKK